MDLKKIVILPACFILIHVLYIGCCKCVESLGGKPYRNITGVIVKENGNAGKFSRDTVYITDTLTAMFIFPFEYIANYTKNPMQQFVGTANALSCHCINIADSGYKYKIDSLKITSDNDIFGIQAGRDLSSLFKGALFNRGSGVVQYNLSVPQVLDSISLTKNYDQFLLLLNRGSPVIKTHKFTYTIFVNGRVFQTISQGKLYWE
jgi:hypothetical protein